MHVATLDIVFAVLILLAAVRVAVKGFVAEFSSIAAFFLGVLAAVLFLKQGTAIAVSWGAQGVVASILAFLGIFVVVFVAIKVVVRLLGTLLEAVHLESLDHALGFILGLAEGILLVAVFLIILRIQPFVHVEKLVNASFIAKILTPLLDTNTIKVLPGAA